MELEVKTNHLSFFFLLIFIIAASANQCLSPVTVEFIYNWDIAREYMEGDLCWLGRDGETTTEMRWKSLQDYNLGNRPWGYNVPPDGLGWHEMSPAWWERTE